MKKPDPNSLLPSEAEQDSFSAHAHGLKLLREAGINQPMAESIVEIDQIFRRWRRANTRREMMQQTCNDLKLDIDATHFEALLVVSGHWITKSPDAAPEETSSIAEVTIGDVANELSIDPSNASRLVADLVTRAYIIRVASQSDGRKSCLQLTTFGEQVIKALARFKWSMMAGIYQDWSETDIKEFLRLLSKFGHKAPPLAAGEKHRAKALAQCDAEISEARKALAQG